MTKKVLVNKTVILHATVAVIYISIRLFILVFSSNPNSNIHIVSQGDADYV